MLNVRASAPTSSARSTSTRSEKSPLPSLRDASCRRTTGSMTERESRRAINAAPKIAARPVSARRSSILFWRASALSVSERMWSAAVWEARPIVTIDRLRLAVKGVSACWWALSRTRGGSRISDEWRTVSRAALDSVHWRNARSTSARSSPRLFSARIDANAAVDLAGVGLKRAGGRARVDDSVAEQLGLAQVGAQVGDREQRGRGLSSSLCRSLRRFARRRRPRRRRGTASGAA